MHIEKFLTALPNLIPALTSRGLKVFVSLLMAMIGLNLLALFLAYQKLAGVALITSALWGLVIIFVGMVLVELVFLYVRRFSSFWQSIRLHRAFSNNLPVYHQSFVKLSLKGYDKPNFWIQYLTLEVMDCIPANAYAGELPVQIQAAEVLDERSDGVEINYPLTPFERGLGVFDGVWVRLFGLWGLFSLIYRFDETQVEGQNSVRVLANFKLTSTGNLLGAAGKTAIDGTLKKIRRGLGQDFHQIRGYSESDSIRHIDWRATSRLGRLMTKEYQDEQDQEILFLLDASMNARHSRYLSTNESDDELIAVSHLDTMLNAMLLLSNVATHQGDSVGFISFSGINDKIVAPKKNATALLLNQSFDIQPSLKMPDYMAAAKTALSLQKKRSLIILMTATRSEEFGEMMQAISLLRAKHLVVVANLYEEDLFAMTNELPNDGNEARTYHSIQEHLGRQHRLKLELESLPQVYGVHCPPSRLAHFLINRYLGLKQSMKF